MSELQKTSTNLNNSVENKCSYIYGSGFMKDEKCERKIISGGGRKYCGKHFYSEEIIRLEKILLNTQKQLEDYELFYDVDKDKSKSHPLDDVSSDEDDLF